MSDPIIIQTLWLLIVAAAVAVGVKWVRLPYTIALVVVGLTLAAMDLFPGVILTPSLLFHLFLPVLLFEAAFHMDFSHLREHTRPIGLLAGPGLLISAGVAAGVTFFGMKLFDARGFSVLHGLVFGVIIAATDPIAVLALFKELGVGRRLSVIMEGESLFNDGVAVVLFGVVTGFITGKKMSVLGAAGLLIMEVAGGALLGLLLGAAAARLMAQVDDHLLEITLTTILAFGSFLLAESLHLSGVIAVIAAGLMTGNYGTRIAMSPTTKVAVSSFWEYAAFLVNSIVFLMIGLEVKLVNLKAAILPVSLGVLAMLLGRGASVVFSSALMKRLWRPLPGRVQGVLFWGGLRGALCMMLAMALPRDMPERQLIMAMIFGAVLFTLLGQGLSIKPLIKRLGLAGVERKDRAYELIKGALIANSRALEELGRLGARGHLTAPNVKGLEEELTGRIKELHQRLDEQTRGSSGPVEKELIAAKKRLLHAEKAGLKDAYFDGLISEETFRELLKDMDERLVELEEGEPGAEDVPVAEDPGDIESGF